MAFPEPEIGQVIRYAYLWRDEARAGREEAIKDRPCVVVLRRAMARGELEVLVAPITHAPPRQPAHGIAVPASTRARLGLDEQDCWVVTTEVNRFVWPGPDLRHAPTGAVFYGLLPGRMVADIIESIRRASGRMVDRDAEELARLRRRGRPTSNDDA